MLDFFKSLFSKVQESTTEFQKAFLFFIFLFSIVFIFFFFFFLKEKKEYELINFKDKDLLEAMKWLQDHSMSVKVFEKIDIKIPVYKIISQNPEPGVKVKEGRTISLVVNSNKTQIKMPNLIGLDFDNARKQIYSLFQNQNIIPQIVRENRFHTNINRTNSGVEEDSKLEEDEIIEEGKIVEQSPKENEVINGDDAIILVVSKGILDEEQKVKNYIYQDFRKVERELSELGIYVKAKYTPSLDRSKVGKIFKQSKEVDSVFLPKDEITFLVATDIDKLNSGEKEKSALLRIVKFKVPDSSEPFLKNIILVVDDALGEHVELEGEYLPNTYLELPYRTLGSGQLSIMVDNQILKIIDF